MKISERSVLSKRLWELEIDTDAVDVIVRIRGDLLRYAAHRSAIDELASVLAQRLHELARDKQRSLGENET